MKIGTLEHLPPEPHGLGGFALVPSPLASAAGSFARSRGRGASYAPMSDLSDSLAKSTPTWAGNVVILFILAWAAKSYFDDKLNQFEQARVEIRSMDKTMAELKGTQQALSTQMGQMVTALERASQNREALQTNRDRIEAIEEWCRERFRRGCKL